VSRLQFASEGSDDFLDGRLDEIRVSSIARNACWVETEYNNQSSPATFYGLGSEEANGNVYTISATQGTDGAISPLGDVTVAEGASKTYNFTPAYGFRVDEVFVDGSSTAFSNNQYTFTNVTADHTIHVTFTPNEGDYTSPDGTFLYRKALTIQSGQMGASCGADLYGFPVLVQILNDNSLKHDSAGGHVQHAEGYDIIFKDASDVPLFHELEHYDGASGSLVAWVRIGAGEQTAGVIPSLQQDTWYYYSIVFDNAGDQIRYYWNGTQFLERRPLGFQRQRQYGDAEKPQRRRRRVDRCHRQDPGSRLFQRRRRLGRSRQQCQSGCHRQRTDLERLGETYRRPERRLRHRD